MTAPLPHSRRRGRCCLAARTKWCKRTFQATLSLMTPSPLFFRKSMIRRRLFCSLCKSIILSCLQRTRLGKPYSRHIPHSKRDPSLNIFASQRPTWADDRFLQEQHFRPLTQNTRKNIILSGLRLHRNAVARARRDDVLPEHSGDATESMRPNWAPPARTRRTPADARRCGAVGVAMPAC